MPHLRIPMLIVVRSPQDANLTGLIVDSVLRIRGVALDAVEEMAAQASGTDHFVRGIIECEGQPVTVLDLERVLLSSGMRQFQTA